MRGKSGYFGIRCQSQITVQEADLRSSSTAEFGQESESVVREEAGSNENLSIPM